MKTLLITLLGASCAALGLGCGGQPASTPAEIRRERADFAARAAAEPASPGRLAVAAVGVQVMAGLDDERVYALTPALAALDRKTGAELWKLADASGEVLGRLGANLSVLRGGGSRTPTLVVVDPRAGATIATCVLNVGAPPEANTVEVHPFDRAGALFVHWRSWSGWRAGTAPPAGYEETRKRAAACGVARFEPATCRLTDEPSFPGFDRDRCQDGSATFTLPAAAAAAPKAYGPGLVVELTEQPQSDSCRRVTKVKLRASAGALGAGWEYPLPDFTSTCGPP